VFYSISVDSKNANQWGNFENLGAYEPLYVSSVDVL